MYGIMQPISFETEFNLSVKSSMLYSNKLSQPWIEVA